MTAPPINELFNIRGRSSLDDAIERFNKLTQTITNIVIKKSLNNWDEIYHISAIKKVVDQFFNDFLPGASRLEHRCFVSQICINHNLFYQYQISSPAFLMPYIKSVVHLYPDDITLSKRSKAERVELASCALRAYELSNLGKINSVSDWHKTGDPIYNHANNSAISRSARFTWIAIITRWLRIKKHVYWKQSNSRLSKLIISTNINHARKLLVTYLRNGTRKFISENNSDNLTLTTIRKSIHIWYGKDGLWNTYRNNHLVGFSEHQIESEREEILKAGTGINNIKRIYHKYTYLDAEQFCIEHDISNPTALWFNAKKLFEKCQNENINDVTWIEMLSKEVPFYYKLQDRHRINHDSRYELALAEMLYDWFSITPKNGIIFQENYPEHQQYNIMKPGGRLSYDGNLTDFEMYYEILQYNNTTLKNAATGKFKNRVKKYVENIEHRKIPFNLALKRNVLYIHVCNNHTGHAMKIPKFLKYAQNLLKENLPDNIPEAPVLTTQKIGQWMTSKIVDKKNRNHALKFLTNYGNSYSVVEQSWLDIEHSIREGLSATEFIKNLNIPKPIFYGVGRTSLDTSWTVRIKNNANRHQACVSDAEIGNGDVLVSLMEAIKVRDTAIEKRDSDLCKKYPDWVAKKLISLKKLPLTGVIFLNGRDSKSLTLQEGLIRSELGIKNKKNNVDFQVIKLTENELEGRLFSALQKIAKMLDNHLLTNININNEGEEICFNKRKLYLYRDITTQQLHNINKVVIKNIKHKEIFYSTN